MVNKIIKIIILFGVTIITIFSLVYSIFTFKSALNKERENLILLSSELSSHIESHIIDKIYQAKTLTTNPKITETLIDDNLYFGSLTDNERDKNIENLENQWDMGKPEFINQYLQNSVSLYLKSQMEIYPDNYGEIFITNRYGVLLSSTNRLTTLSHSSKYWWKGSYNRGYIFIDDRGYDESVKDYVLGIAVPIFSDNEVIGILKSNVRIIEPITDIISSFNKRNSSKALLIRSEGEVLTDGKNSFNRKTRWSIEGKQVGSGIYKENGHETIYAYTPLNINIIDHYIIYGGEPSSIDHSSGNRGDEPWFVVIELNMNTLIAKNRSIVFFIISMFIISMFLVVISAKILGNWSTKPIVELAKKTLKHNPTLTEFNNEIDMIQKHMIDMSVKLKKVNKAKQRLKSNIEHHKSLELKLKKISKTDELTNTYNKRAFNSHINRNISSSKRHNTDLSLLMLDIDKYKDVNDNFGHNTGDNVLKDLAEILNNCIREEDIVSRIGGDEFCIILPHTDGKTAKILAERIRFSIENNIFNEVGKITVSVGVGQLHSGDSAESLLKRADTSLYSAKESGRNSVFYE